jgi:leucyl aminopeptidase
MTNDLLRDLPGIPIVVVQPEALQAWLEAAPDIARNWVRALGFRAGLGETLCVPGPDGSLDRVLVGWGTAAARRRERFNLARAIERLPEGRYHLAPCADTDIDLDLEALGWQLEGYRFERYRKVEAGRPVLSCPDGVDASRLAAIERGATLARDLINTPACDLGPAALEQAFLDLAGRFAADARAVRGVADLREGNFPLIAAVGAAAAEAPRLLDMVWGEKDAPRVTLVGKGVCFDTGGLNIKPGASMGLMKKDMGGAATAMGLASIIMELRLPIRLRLLVPAVENAISEAAMRPGDILPSRKGLTVEVNNTDAEGRLVLADALALADEDAPDLMVSLATLTGAARVALGPDIPPFFCDDDLLAGELSWAAERVADPLWRLPFWDPYEALIEPGIADLDNAPGGGMAGAITAALFLRRFVSAASTYVHLDIYGWTPAAKPGRPKGGAFQAARALLEVLESRFCPAR